jgi:hypothetical protein
MSNYLPDGCTQDDLDRYLDGDGQEPNDDQTDSCMDAVYAGDPRDEDPDEQADCGHFTPRRLMEPSGGRDLCRECFAQLKAGVASDAQAKGSIHLDRPTQAVVAPLDVVALSDIDAWRAYESAVREDLRCLLCGALGCGGECAYEEDEMEQTRRQR